jgi:periplasmic protein TonB
MASKINIFADDWCDMVFEKRNQNYGAFILRKLSNRRHMIALSIAIAFFVLGVSTPTIIKSIRPAGVEKDVSVRVMTDIKLDKPKDKVDELIKELPPPPVLKNVIKFTAPVIKPDEQVAEEDEPKMQQEVVDSKAAIGTINYDKGTDDPTAEMPDVMPSEDQQIAEETIEPFLVVEQMPDFPGGEGELYKYLQDKIKYPPMARESGITGTVYVRFIVDKHGKISNVTLLRGIGGGCDEEAIRVVQAMPDWKPGRQNGMPVPVYFTLPVKFILR